MHPLEPSMAEPNALRIAMATPTAHIQCQCPVSYAHVHLLTHRPFQCPCPWAKLLQLPHALSSRDAHACVSPTAQLFAPLEYGDSEAAALHVTGTWRKLAHEGKQTKEEEFHVQATSTPELSRCQA